MFGFGALAELPIAGLPSAGPPGNTNWYPKPRRYWPTADGDDEDIVGTERRRTAAIDPSRNPPPWQPKLHRLGADEEIEDTPAPERRKLTPGTPQTQNAWNTRPTRRGVEDDDELPGRERRRSAANIPVVPPPTTWLQKLARRIPDGFEDDELPGPARRLDQRILSGLWPRPPQDVIAWFPGRAATSRRSVEDDDELPGQRNHQLFVTNPPTDWYPKPARYRPAVAEEDEGEPSREHRKVTPSIPQQPSTQWPPRRAFFRPGVEDDDELPGRERRKVTPSASGAAPPWYAPKPAHYRPIVEDDDELPGPERRHVLSGLWPRPPQDNITWTAPKPRRPDPAEPDDEPVGRERRKLAAGLGVQPANTVWFPKPVRFRPDVSDDDELPGVRSHRLAPDFTGELPITNTTWRPKPLRYRPVADGDDDGEETLWLRQRRVVQAAPATLWLQKNGRRHPLVEDDDEGMLARRARVTPVGVPSNVLIAPAQIIFIRQTTPTAINIFLPPSNASGKLYAIKDSLGVCAAFSFTVKTLDGSLIDGKSSFVMNVAYQCIVLAFDGIQWNIIAKF